MNSTTWIIIGVVTGTVLAAYVALFIYRKRQLEKFFNQVFDMAKQVPKQKKTSFLLLLFKESMPAPKKKDKNKVKNKDKKAKTLTGYERLNNPKHLEFQMIQMTNILKDPSKVQDKTTKKALGLLKDYQAWEKIKVTKANQKPQVKAS